MIEIHVKLLSDFNFNKILASLHNIKFITLQPSSYLIVDKEINEYYMGITSLPLPFKVRIPGIYKL